METNTAPETDATPESLHYEAMKGLMENEKIRYEGGLDTKAASGNNNFVKKKEEGKPFHKWLYDDAETQTPAKMNCWEAVLFAAHRAGLADKDYIKRAIAREKSGGMVAFAKAVLQARTGSVATPMQNVDEMKKANIPKGYVVIFGEEGQHVALSTGTMVPIAEKGLRQTFGETGHGIIELDYGVLPVKQTTVEETVTQSKYATVVSWGPLPKL